MMDGVADFPRIRYPVRKREVAGLIIREVIYFCSWRNVWRVCWEFRSLEVLFDFIIGSSLLFVEHFYYNCVVLIVLLIVN